MGRRPAARPAGSPSLSHQPPPPPHRPHPPPPQAISDASAAALVGARLLRFQMGARGHRRRRQLPLPDLLHPTPSPGASAAPFPPTPTYFQLWRLPTAVTWAGGRATATAGQPRQLCPTRIAVRGGRRRGGGEGGTGPCAPFFSPSPPPLFLSPPPPHPCTPCVRGTVAAWAVSPAARACAHSAAAAVSPPLSALLRGGGGGGGVQGSRWCGRGGWGGGGAPTGTTPASAATPLASPLPHRLRCHPPPGSGLCGGVAWWACPASAVRWWRCLRGSPVAVAREGGGGGGGVPRRSAVGGVAGSRLLR